MRWNGEPEPLADAGGVEAEVDALNDGPLAHLEDVRVGSLVARVEDGHVVFVVADVVIDDAIGGVDAFTITVARFLNRFFQASAVVAACWLVW